MAAIRERKVSDEILMGFMVEMRKSVNDIKTSVAKNATNIAIVATELKGVKKGRMRDNAYIAIITILISGSCLLMGYVWGQEKTKTEHGKQETVRQEAQ